MKGFVALLLGLVMIATTTGCCCWNKPCAPYQSCPGGACPPTGGVMYPPTSYGVSAYSPTAVAPIAAAPQTYYSNYPATALAPLESLPTY